MYAEKRKNSMGVDVEKSKNIPIDFLTFSK